MLGHRLGPVQGLQLCDIVQRNRPGGQARGFEAVGGIHPGRLGAARRRVKRETAGRRRAGEPDRPCANDILQFPQL